MQEGLTELLKALMNSGGDVADVEQELKKTEGEDIYTISFLNFFGGKSGHCQINWMDFGAQVRMQWKNWECSVMCYLYMQ